MNFPFLNPEIITAVRLQEISSQTAQIQSDYIDRILIHDMDQRKITQLACNIHTLS